MEIVEGKDAAQGEYLDGNVKKGTAMLARLTKPWHAMGRKVVANSYLASVQACVFLRKQCGLVKASSKMFLKKHLQTCAMGARGDTKTFTGVKDSVQLMAHVWNNPGKPGKQQKSLVLTCGTTTAGAPAK